MSNNPKIQDAHLITVLMRAIPTNPGDRLLWEGLTREDLAKQLRMFKTATVYAKVRKAARRGLVEVCECGNHVRPTQQGVDMATDWFRKQSPIGNPIPAEVE